MTAQMHNPQTQYLTGLCLVYWMIQAVLASPDGDGDGTDPVIDPDPPKPKPMPPAPQPPPGEKGKPKTEEPQ